MKKKVKEFYGKQIEYNKFFEKKKKISFDTSDKFLEIMNKLVKLTYNNRTVIINALIGAGMSPFFKILEDTWKKYLKEHEKKWDEKAKKNLKKLIEDLKKLKKKYQIE